jgi:hypothetical protein
MANPPLRLTLGADAYQAVSEALRARGLALEAQRDIACAVAADD